MRHLPSIGLRVPRFTLCLLGALALGAGCATGGAVDSAEDDATGSDALSCSGKTVRGVDVSHYQLDVDWKKAKASGIDFAFASVGDGSYADPDFAKNWRGTKKAGVVRGAYQYFRPSEDATHQADLLISSVNQAGGLDKGDLAPALDLETFDGESRATVVARAKEWLEHVMTKLHVTPIVYVSPGFWSSLGDPGGFSDYTLWIADWGVSCPSVPGAFKKFTFWQFSDDANLPGIPKAVDEDRFNGSLADLLKFAGAADASKPSESLAEKEATLEEAEMEGDLSTDIDGDGKADVCAFNGSDLRCYLSTGKGFRANPISGPVLDGKDFDEALHYGSIRFGDINGDGKADVCVRRSTGVDCFHSKGDSFGPAIKTKIMADDNGWDDPKNWSSFRLADVDGDGKADLCARGDKHFRCWRSNGDGFGAAIDGPDWSEKGAYGEIASWGTIQMPDIDGDGKADVCAHNADGITCYLSDGHGFPHHVKGPQFAAKSWDKAETWATIRFGDIDGDGKADLCVRKTDGVKCYLSHGTHFGPEIQGPDLTDGKGWDKADNYETLRLVDVDGDGKADLCARADDGVTCWLSNGHGFGHPVHTALLDDASKGDSGSHYRTLRFADIDGDGKADLCFRSTSGLRCALADEHGFRKAFDGPAWSDKNGWDKQERYATISLAGL